MIKQWRFVLTTIVFLVSLSVLSGCNTETDNSLTREKAAEVLAKIYNVTKDDIQIINIGPRTGSTFTVSFRVRQDNSWQPSEKGFYMGELTEEKSGEYKLTIPHYSNDRDK